MPPNHSEADDWVLVSGKTNNSTSSTSKDNDVEPEGLDIKITALLANTLIPGKGKPLHDQAVICEDGKITYVGSPDSLPPNYDKVIFKKVPVLMPGMWECHSHFMGASPDLPINSENLAMTNAAVAGARNVRALKETLYAGFTSCVDLGGYGPELQKVIDEGLILGPTIYGAGGAISMTGGHGDVFEIPLGSAWQKLSINAPGTDVGTCTLLLADGIEECRKAVRVNVRRGAKVIKVMTSGGVTSRDDDPRRQQFSDEELKTISSEAERLGLVCCAHAVGKAGILAAIRAGFKVIEHNSYADDEVFKAMKKNDVLLVATITPLRSVLDNKDKYPPPMYEKVRRMAETHMKAYENAIKAGVRCALGSDLFGGIGTVLSPGLNGHEVVHAVEAGMSPLDAIAAATAHGPETLGEQQAPKSGQIKKGYDADFLGLESNPLDDISVLKKPKKIKWVWKSGRLVKGPGVDSWDALER